MTNMTPEQQAAKKYPWLMNETVGNAKIEHKREAYADCISEKVEPLEEELEQKTAENVKLRDLGAELANSINILIGARRDVESLLTLNEKTALAAVAAWTDKELGFVPTNTTEG